MSRPRPPLPVKLITSVFSPDTDLIGRVLDEFSRSFGTLDWISPELFFDRTKYYEKEMGSTLHRRFASFERFIFPDQIVSVKLFTNGIEGKWTEGVKRRVNIDPGYISPERLVLATGKNFSHRVYLSEGIYADLTLIYKQGTFTTLPWTYEDYADPDMIQIFNALRKDYLARLKEMGIL